MAIDTKGLEHIQDAIFDVRSILDRLEMNIGKHEQRHMRFASLVYETGTCTCGHVSTTHSPFSGVCLDSSCKCDYYIEAAETRWVEFSEQR